MLEAHQGCRQPWLRSCPVCMQHAQVKPTARIATPLPLPALVVGAAPVTVDGQDVGNASRPGVPQQVHMNDSSVKPCIGSRPLSQPGRHARTAGSNNLLMLVRKCSAIAGTWTASNAECSPSQGLLWNPSFRSASMSPLLGFVQEVPVRVYSYQVQ